MAKEICGVYQIQCSVSGKSYVGSSRAIYKRWYSHRRLLRKGTHVSPRLQQAWIKHGEGNFTFSVLEECPVDALFVREQHYIDLCKRDYNSMPVVKVITPEMRSKMVAANRARAAAITHCPHGHEYTAHNKRIGTNGEPKCRECARLRARAAIAAETPQEYAERLRKCREFHEANKEYRTRQMAEYRNSEGGKEKKREYDRLHLAEKRARRAKAKAEGRAYG